MNRSIRNHAAGIRRVAIVSHTSSLYGAGRSLLELIHSLRLMKLEVGVILPENGLLVSALQQLDCKIWNLHIPAWVQTRTEQSTPKHTLQEFALVARILQKKIESWQPDLLWTNSTMTPVGALTAESLGISHVWHLRELNGGQYPHDFCVGESAAVDLISASDIRVAVSLAVKDYYEGLGCGNCEWIYNGIGPSSQLASRARLANTGPTRLVIVGRVGAFKNTRTAIEASSLLRSRGYPVILRVVGDGDIQNCREIARKSGVRDQVEFTGFVSQVDDHFRWADIALSCASDEAMGRSTAEAMSWGLPIAGHGAAGTGEMVAQSGGGLLYDGSAEDLACAIAVLIDDPVSAESMGKAGQRWAQAHVSSEQHSSRIRKVVETASCEVAGISKTNVVFT